MYSDIEINTLSKNQISKLLNGHPVRLMVGVGHTLAVSSEQYKKLMKAKKMIPLLLLHLIHIKLMKASI